MHSVILLKYLRKGIKYSAQFEFLVNTFDSELHSNQIFTLNFLLHQSNLQELTLLVKSVQDLNFRLGTQTHVLNF